MNIERVRKSFDAVIAPLNRWIGVRFHVEHGVDNVTIAVWFGMGIGEVIV